MELETTAPLAGCSAVSGRSVRHGEQMCTHPEHRGFRLYLPEHSQQPLPPGSLLPARLKIGQEPGGSLQTEDAAQAESSSASN